VRSTARRALRQAGGTTADDRSKNPRGRAMLLMIENWHRQPVVAAAVRHAQ